jgi:hypothetical protein
LVRELGPSNVRVEGTFRNLPEQVSIAAAIVSVAAQEFDGEARTFEAI